VSGTPATTVRSAAWESASRVVQSAIGFVMATPQNGMLCSA
jgi:hypothetical protein